MFPCYATRDVTVSYLDEVTNKLISSICTLVSEGKKCFSIEMSRFSVNIIYTVEEKR